MILARYDYGGGCACGLERECNCKFAERGQPVWNNKKDIPMTKEHDFGFSTDVSVVTDDQIKTVTDQYLALTMESQRWAKNMDNVLKEVDILLDNLAKDPDKELIKWPNRAAKIKEFKEKLKKIAFYEGK